MGYGVNNKPVIKSLGTRAALGAVHADRDGKSVTAELLEAQMLFHGAVGFILDYKVFSTRGRCSRCRTWCTAGSPRRSTWRCCG